MSYRRNLEGHGYGNDIISKRHQSDIATYNNVINGMCIEGKIDEADDNLSSMIARRHKADVMDYIFLLMAYDRMVKVMLWSTFCKRELNIT